jgi:hypothetical protein
MTPRSAGTGPAGPTLAYRFEDADPEGDADVPLQVPRYLSAPHSWGRETTAPPPVLARRHRLRRPASTIDP